VSLPPQCSRKSTGQSAPLPHSRFCARAELLQEEEAATADEVRNSSQADDEAHLIDWKGLICTLCKRKLKDLPTLTKHVEASELHQTNLRAYRESRRGPR